ncbi:MAG: tetratricopeptide repeat protein, partial [Pseudomonadota bacterium]|nr:tetratricopeptide repeat protein [Pseudomonadota bacterium]
MMNSQKLTIQQAISRAKKAIKQGKIADAVELYTAVLQHQPNHPIAKKRLRKLQKELPQTPSMKEKMSSPPQDEIDALVNLYHSGQMIKAEQASRELLKPYPQALVAINVLGAALRGQGKLQEAVQAYDKAIQLNPDYAEAHSNLGNTLQDLGRLEDAVASYRKAIALKPDYA